eukprot:TRINITY_DN10178_c0_g1_i1.p1 TRINITY_DN10178_c0_g1~~TRINITY_DN10178_c0_g1_i1.p1  ORF type:complete len:270 (-),score=44.15 TRINITY_DN10178_c0_g1_i1:86-895(-)
MFPEISPILHLFYQVKLSADIKGTLSGKARCYIPMIVCWKAPPLLQNYPIPLAPIGVPTQIRIIQSNLSTELPVNLLPSSYETYGNALDNGAYDYKGLNIKFVGKFEAATNQEIDHEIDKNQLAQDLKDEGYKNGWLTHDDSETSSIEDSFSRVELSQSHKSVASSTESAQHLSAKKEKIETPPPNSPVVLPNSPTPKKFISVSMECEQVSQIVMEMGYPHEWILEQKINGEVFMDLGHNELKEFGVEKYGDRHLILKLKGSITNHTNQ